MKKITSLSKIRINEGKEINPEFWVVTKPTDVSTLADIWFKSNPNHYANQIRGGLKEDEVAGFYNSEADATEVANKLLEKKSKS